MNQNVEKLEKLQKLADRQKIELAKIEGRIESLMDELKKLGFSSVEDAKKELKSMEVKLNKRTEVFNRKLTAFYKKYGQLIQKSN